MWERCLGHLLRDQLIKDRWCIYASVNYAIIGSSLTCRLFASKNLHETTLTGFQSDYTQLKFESKCVLRKYIIFWKYLLNVSYLKWVLYLPQICNIAINPTVECVRVMIGFSNWYSCCPLFCLVFDRACFVVVVVWFYLFCFCFLLFFLGGLQYWTKQVVNYVN